MQHSFRHNAHVFQSSSTESTFLGWVMVLGCFFSSKPIPVLFHLHFSAGRRNGTRQWWNGTCVFNQCSNPTSHYIKLFTIQTEKKIAQNVYSLLRNVALNFAWDVDVRLFTIMNGMTEHFQIPDKQPTKLANISRSIWDMQSKLRQGRCYRYHRNEVRFFSIHLRIVKAWRSSSCVWFFRIWITFLSMDRVVNLVRYATPASGQFR